MLPGGALAMPAAPLPGGLPPPGMQLPGASPWSGPYFEPTTGRYYYYNLYTQQSEWAAPTAAPAPAMYPPQYGAPGYPAYPAMPMMTMPPQDPAAFGASAAYGASGFDPLGQAVDRREHCSDFKRGKCDRGAACKYAHIKSQEECGDFKRGRCTRGATCKFLHIGAGGDAAGRSRSRSR